ncbi:amino acid permease [Gaetbulibacter sp. M240]|uniref:amino acid permease n=1 Tax=Gaetbulibacter sp. M240 TaxID=3126511 RepID=UPI00374FA013
MTSKKPQKIGLITTTSLVIGNMIGVGIFVLPTTLAEFGSISLLGWVFTAAGAIILAKIFSNLSKIIVNKSGGPYVFSREGFGDFIGFLVAWGYWICVWLGNGAIVIGVVGALSFFFPVLKTDPLMALGVSLALIWLFTWVNSRGIKESGKFQVVTTVLKVVPLLFIIIFGVFFFKIENFPAFNLTSESNFLTLPAVSVYTLFAFLGLESASIPAGNVKDPDITVPKATMIGTIFTAIIYILATIVLFGILPNSVLRDNPKPFADAAQLIAGDFGGYFIAVGVVISGIGVLNGWILISAQVPMATARDELFPKIFKKENKNGAPVYGLVIGSTLTSIGMIASYGGGLAEQFKMIADVSVFAVLVPYLLTSAAYILIVIERKLHLNSVIKTFVLGGLGFTFSLWAIFGSGADTVFYGFILLLLGIPFYLIMRYNKRVK